MSDAKISALPAATTPLAGTEVLPIVQSSTTVKVAVQDLNPVNLKSNATSGVIQVVGPAAGTTRVMTTPNANFTAARTDAAQTFTGDQTLGTGNLVIGTIGKGIDFSINVHSGSTNKVLSDYEEGTWTATDASGAGLTMTTNYAYYVRIGRTVYVSAYIAYPPNSSSANARIGGLPFTVPANSYVPGPIITNSSQSIAAEFLATSTSFLLVDPTNGASRTNISMNPGYYVLLAGAYLI